MDLKNWLFPSIIFCLFLYGVLFLVIFAFRANDTTYDLGAVDNVGKVTTVKEFQDELNKTMNRK